MYVFGGLDETSPEPQLGAYSNELEVFNLREQSRIYVLYGVADHLTVYREWVQYTGPEATVKITGLKPKPRGYHTAILNDLRLWIFGGYDGKEPFDDTWILDLAALAYTPNVTNWAIADIFAEVEES